MLTRSRLDSGFPPFKALSLNLSENFTIVVVVVVLSVVVSIDGLCPPGSRGTGVFMCPSPTHDSQSQGLLIWRHNPQCNPVRQENSRF